MKKLLTILAMLATFSLVAAACGSDAETAVDAVDDAADAAEDAVDDAMDEADDAMEDGDDAMEDGDDAMDEMEEHDSLGDGSLGTVVVEAGAEVQIRSLNVISGENSSLGIPNQRGVELAITDYGSVKGFDISMGAGLDDTCSADGGAAAAQTIVADDDIVGVIGTSCSGAATAAAPLIGAANMVMISPSNTSPALTSDKQGNAGANYNEGYYRTAHNDLFQGAAMAEFVFNELGLTTAAAMHDGDPYTEGVASAFRTSFEELGGTVTGFTAIAPTDTDMIPVLTELAVDSPEALFFPLFRPAGDFVADQAPGVSGLEDATLLSSDSLLSIPFFELPQSEGMYFSGPDLGFGGNVNESTGKNADDFLAAYDEAYGEPPSAPFWAHAYDATAILLDAIDAASHIDADGNLEIDRAGVREYLDGLTDYAGLIGNLSCDDFGDCGTTKITVVEHTDASNAEEDQNNVIFSFGG